MVSLNLTEHKSYFCKNKPYIKALEKKMQMHRVPGPSYNYGRTNLLQ